MLQISEIVKKTEDINKFLLKVLYAIVANPLDLPPAVFQPHIVAIHLA